jgi:hypothetical protein
MTAFLISAFLTGLFLSIAIPACFHPYGPAQRRAIGIWGGLYLFAVFAALAALQLYIALSTGTIGFFRRGMGGFISFADSPVLFVLLLPIFVGLPLCFALLFFGLFRSARNGDGTGL